MCLHFSDFFSQPKKEEEVSHTEKKSLSKKKQLLNEIQSGEEMEIKKILIDFCASGPSVSVVLPPPDFKPPSIIEKGSKV